MKKTLRPSQYGRFSNRHIHPLPEYPCEISFIYSDYDGTKELRGIWFPKSYYPSPTPNDIEPSPEWLGHVTHITERGVQIGFNVWDCNDSEFLWYINHGRITTDEIKSESMNYHGRLFGQVGGQFFDTGRTTDEWDAMEIKIKQLEAAQFSISRVSELLRKASQETWMKCMGTMDGWDEWFNSRNKINLN